MTLFERYIKKFGLTPAEVEKVRKLAEEVKPTGRYDKLVAHLEGGGEHPWYWLWLRARRAPAEVLYTMRNCSVWQRWKHRYDMQALNIGWPPVWDDRFDDVLDPAYLAEVRAEFEARLRETVRRGAR